MTRKHPYSRGWMGIPSFLVAVSWVALWWVWPSPDMAGSRRTVSNTRLFYTHLSGGSRNPIIFVLPSRLPDEEDELAGSLLNHRVSNPWHVKRKDGKTERELVARPERSLRDIGEGRRYRPVWPVSPVFSAAKKPPSGMVVGMSNALKESGFNMPDLSIKALEQGGKAWQVVATVQVDADGRPSHVFIETSSGNSSIDATVERALYRGHVARPGKKCEGRVTVTRRVE